MEKNTPKRRLRLNLFDGIVLIAALGIGAFLLWSLLKPQAAPGEQASASTVRYTVRLQEWLEGTSHLAQAGDRLTDSVKNYDIGTVVSVEARPAQVQMLDNDTREFVQTPLAGFEDVYLTVESPCTYSSESILLGGGYTLRVGAEAYVRGQGYMGSGYIVAIEREGQA